jgi:hypothetical protein
MAHCTLIARINAGNGKFPFVNVQFSKNHRPIPIDGASYYLRPSNRGNDPCSHLIHPASSKQCNGSSPKHEVVSSDGSCRTR